MLHFRNLKTSLHLFLSITIAASNVVASNYGRCDSQFDDDGLCVQLADCQYIMDLFSGVLNKDTAETLRKSQCGYDNTYVEKTQRILVCCPMKYLRRERTGMSNESLQPGNVLPKAGECGVGIENFIYGGNRTRLSDYPWMALIRYSTPTGKLEFLCGGSLINTRYVLTAAHCMNFNNNGARRTIHSVRLGEWDLTTDPDCEEDVRQKKFCAPPFVEVAIERAIAHPKYVRNSLNQYYDVALLRLAESVTYSDYIRPICLPAAEELCSNTFVGNEMEVAGWGATQTQDTSAVKMKIKVKVWETDKCQNTYKALDYSINNEHHLCAGGISGVDSCRGDSGGPLMFPEVLNNRFVYFVAGVISFGPKPCGFENWPGVYARVGTYSNWITNTLEP